MQYVEHTLEPWFWKDSSILLLGSMPSIQSRKENCYYAHPQNRFWKILEIIYDEKIVDKTNFLLSHNLALWDVIKSCTINNSSDASIKNVNVNDLEKIIKNSQIQKIILNGQKATKLYNKYFKNKINLKVISLPSTSPANAQYSLEDLVLQYRKHFLSD